MLFTINLKLQACVTGPALKSGVTVWRATRTEACRASKVQLPCACARRLVGHAILVSG